MRTALALAAFVVISCFVAWGQTAIEYSTISSGTATGISRAGNTTTNTLGEVGKRLGNAVNSPSSNTLAQPVSSSSDTAMRSNRQVLDQQAQQRGCGPLHISSVPKDATLYVDHLAVAATPADLCLPIGKHTLELKSRGFKAWSHEVTINTGETLTLAPKLIEEKQAKDYRRTINLSF
jgi:hypothetical protein